MLALKGLTPSGQLPLGVLSQGKSGLSSGESEMTMVTGYGLVLWFIGFHRYLLVNNVRVCGRGSRSMLP